MPYDDNIIRTREKEPPVLSEAEKDALKNLQGWLDPTRISPRGGAFWSEPPDWEVVQLVVEQVTKEVDDKDRSVFDLMGDADRQNVRNMFEQARTEAARRRGEPSQADPASATPRSDKQPRTAPTPASGTTTDGRT